MGNYRFRFSDMMPNAWFSKLKGINRTRKHNSLHLPNTKNSLSSATSQKSHHFAVDPRRASRFHNSPTHPKGLDTHFPGNTPKRSYSMKRTRRKTVYRPSPRLKHSASSVSASYRCHATNGSLVSNGKSSLPVQVSQDEDPDSPIESSRESLSSGSDDGDFAVIPLASDGKITSWPCPCDGKFNSSGPDIVIDMNNDDPSTEKFNNVSSSESASELEVPCASRKDANAPCSGDQVIEFKKRPKKESKPESPGRKSSGNSPGIRLRVNSPKIRSRKTQASTHRGVSKTGLEYRSKGITDSFAIILSSVEPERDFRESMLEMIVENNIRKSKDLEDLLACYLSLNSNEYHGIIIRAFEKLWLDAKSSRL